MLCKSIIPAGGHHLPCFYILFVETYLLANCLSSWFCLPQILLFYKPLICIQRLSQIPQTRLPTWRWQLLYYLIPYKGLGHALSCPGHGAVYTFQEGLAEMSQGEDVP